MGIVKRQEGCRGVVSGLLIEEKGVLSSSLAVSPGTSQWHKATHLRDAP